MRMQRIFRDLEVQFNAEKTRALENQARHRARTEYLSVTMRERFAALHGLRLKVCGTDNIVRAGTLEAVGQGWIQLSNAHENILIPEPSILWWENDQAEKHIKVDVQARAYRFNLADACYALMMAREPVRLFTIASAGMSAEGILTRVGADFVELYFSSGDGYSYSGPEQQRGMRIIPTPRITAILTIN